MDNSVKNQHTGLRVQIDQSRVRQTPRTDFGSVMATGVKKATNVAMSAGAIAAPFVPGGAILSAAITGVGTLKSAAGSMSAAGGSNATTLIGSSGAPISGGATSAMGSSGTGAIGSTGGATSSDPMVAQRQMMEMSQQFNMQYLMLQQEMQSDNRRFSTLSNVMKTKHDTAKNSISNMR
jgi:hypothetical protein